MYGNNTPPLVPRNGHTLVVGVIARISGCQNQKEESLQDQIDHAKEVVAEMYTGSVEYRIIATKGKGERLDRPELEQIEVELRKGELDLLIMEDLGRLIRGAEATWILGIGVDHGVRAIVPNDCIDTADESWEEDVIEASAEHVGHNRHTSKRLKKKLMNRFRKYGGATARPIYGVLVPAGAKTYADWEKDVDATPIIQEGARLLRATLNCSRVAEFFNAKNVPIRRHRRSRASWNGQKIRQYYRNPLLKGLTERGRRFTIKHYETGARLAVKNPDGPCIWECPHLAHLSPEEFDELNRLLDKRNCSNRRNPVNGVDPLFHVPRKRTRFPGQHACCWYCGRQYVWGGNGITDHLMCSGSRERHCWNSIGFDGVLAVTATVKAITAVMYLLDDFDEQFQTLVQAANQDRNGHAVDRWKKLEQDEAALCMEKNNLTEAIAKVGLHEMLEHKMQQLETREKELAGERRKLETLRTRDLKLPTCVAELRKILEEKYQNLAINSPEMGDLLRQIVPEFTVYLVRLCDGGHLLPRAKVKLSLAGIVPDAQYVPEMVKMLTREVTLDLFEPPQRARIREEAVRLAAQGLTCKEIAGRIAEMPTATAVQNALALDRLMKQMGLTDPYVLLEEPPENYSKLRRYKNRKYEFKPMDGYQRPTI